MLVDDSFMSLKVLADTIVKVMEVWNIFAIVSRLRDYMQNFVLMRIVLKDLLLILDDMAWFEEGNVCPNLGYLIRVDILKF